MENWPKETQAQLRDRVLRAVIETRLQDATPGERAGLLPTIRDFQEREREKEGLAERQKTAFRSLQLRISILAVIATVFIGAAAVTATLVASHSAAPIVIQAAPATFTPYPTPPSPTPTASPHH